MIHSLIYNMYVDLCRRFTLGATIENTLIKLWVYNRSIIIASKPFDFNEVKLVILIHYSSLMLRMIGAGNAY